MPTDMQEGGSKTWGRADNDWYLVWEGSWLSGHVLGIWQEPSIGLF